MSSRRSDAPNPGRSTAKRRACSASEAQIGANAYTLSGHGLVSRTAGSCALPLSAHRTRTPATVRKSTCKGVVGMQRSLRLPLRNLALTAVLAWALLGAFRFPLGLAESHSSPPPCSR
jgi:hypothetical protein